eukprot:gene7775-7221_t
MAPSSGKALPHSPTLAKANQAAPIAATTPQTQSSFLAVPAFGLDGPWISLISM